MTTPQQPDQPQPDQPQPVHARVQPQDTQAPPTRQLDEHDMANQSAEPAGPDPQGRGRRTRIAGIGLVFLALGLVALASWWTLNTRTPTTPQPDALPTRAIEMITSGTPIPQRFSNLTANDTLGDLSYAPDSKTWSPALAQARQAQEDGRYTSAISQYSALVGSSNSQEARDALWGLASAYAADGQTDTATRAYSLFTYLRDDPRAAQAFFKIGELQRLSGQWQVAQTYYQEYDKHAGPARHAVMLLRADLMGGVSDAVSVYKGVIDDNPQDIDLRNALEGLAGVYSELGRHDDALKTYNRLADLEKASPRPLIDNIGDPPDMESAVEMHLLGNDAGAKQRLLNYIKDPSNYADGRHAALGQLIGIDTTAVVSGTVDPLLAAQVSFEAGYYSSAVDQLNILRTNETDPARRSAAALLTGRAYSATGDYQSAFNWYTATLQNYPNSSQAPEAARRAGDVLREQASWDEAMGAYTLAVNKYPTSPQADLARLNGGVLAYRLEQRDTALGMLQPLTQRPEFSPTLKAQADFWMSKIEKSQGKQGWQSNLKEVSKLAPGSYFDFRARSILAGEPDDGPVAPTFSESKVVSGTLGVQYDKEATERADLLRWAAGLGGTATGTPTPVISQTGISPRLAKDAEVQRAAALLQLGYKSEAQTAFKLLADRLGKANDAEGLAEITLYLRYHADADLAMQVAEKLEGLDKTNDPARLPTLLLKTLYPTPYSDLVLPESRTWDIDPLVMYALIRQESQFVPDAQSSADARGLTQVVPSTGDGIADQLGDRAFLPSMLFLPYVNVRYGTYYLASNLPQFNRKLIPTLAAYNGGPGNASRWLAGSALFDPDLYAERIDLFETGDYIQRVYQNYGFYKEIYGK